jgi:hypothetical protein
MFYQHAGSPFVNSLKGPLQPTDDNGRVPIQERAELKLASLNTIGWLDDQVPRLVKNLAKLRAASKLPIEQPLVVANLEYGPVSLPYTDTQAMRQVRLQAKRQYSLQPEAIRLYLVDGAKYTVPAWSPTGRS